MPSSLLSPSLSKKEQQKQKKKDEEDEAAANQPPVCVWLSGFNNPTAQNPSEETSYYSLLSSSLFCSPSVSFISSTKQKSTPKANTTSSVTYAKGLCRVINQVSVSV